MPGAGGNDRPHRPGVCHHRLRAKRRTANLLVFEADNTAIVHDMDPPKRLSLQAGRRCRRSSVPSRPCCTGVPAGRNATRGLMRSTTRPRWTVTLDPEDWAAIARPGARMLDDMLDYIAHIRERPVWQPIPEHVRARISAGACRAAATTLADGAWRIHGLCPSLCRRQCASRFHGLGAWRRHRRWACWPRCWPAGLNANLGGRDQAPIEVERQILEWVRRIVRLSRRRQRPFRHRHLHGQSPGRAGRAHRKGWAARAPAAGIGGRPGLRAYASAAAHGCIAAGDGPGGLGHAMPCAWCPVDAPSAWTSRRCAPRSRRDRAAGLDAFHGRGHRPARWMPARSTI